MFRGLFIKQLLSLTDIFVFLLIRNLQSFFNPFPQIIVFLTIEKFRKKCVITKKESSN